jgi:hypothetical protein
MSALGQKRTFPRVRPMSAYPQKRTLKGDSSMSALCQKQTLTQIKVLARLDAILGLPCNGGGMVLNSPNRTST